MSSGFRTFIWLIVLVLGLTMLVFFVNYVYVMPKWMISIAAVVTFLGGFLSGVIPPSWSTNVRIHLTTGTFLWMIFGLFTIFVFPEMEIEEVLFKTAHSMLIFFIPGFLIGLGIIMTFKSASEQFLPWFFATKLYHGNYDSTVQLRLIKWFNQVHIYTVRGGKFAVINSYRDVLNAVHSPVWISDDSIYQDLEVLTLVGENGETIDISTDQYLQFILQIIRKMPKPYKEVTLEELLPNNKELLVN